MLSVAFVLMASAAAGDALPAERRGAHVASAQVRAVVMQPAVVRQASGPQVQPGAPVPQISRRGRRVLVEYQ